MVDRPLASTQRYSVISLNVDSPQVESQVPPRPAAAALPSTSRR